MRTAFSIAGSVGVRAVRVLQSEPGVEAIGIFGAAPRLPKDPRIGPVGDLGSFDVLVMDADPPSAAVLDAAVEARVSVVLAADEVPDQYAEAFEEAGATLFIGASVSSAIAPALASQEAALCEEPLEITIAWTVPGRLRRRGEPIPFPEPVGSLWAYPVDPNDDSMAGVPVQRFIAPAPGPWAAAMTRVAGIMDDGVTTKVVGVADDGQHLAAIALAAAAVPVARNEFPPGPARVSWAPATAFLDRAIAAGLEVATYSLHQSDA